ncbi:hypothetical protein TEPIDINF_001601 [Tepidibacillus infernus]|uniref:Uncharacterized protein n=1 Tax=Tepidibacillus decaturensis TaxID=1413211 RepID=A0A135L5A9_9BACI|nr:hypothetical protein [Tepidibacillus decaturensis]KXG44120.1 hypothetical protein U473_08980 [Tepidibacillus decaturensis]
MGNLDPENVAYEFIVYELKMDKPYELNKIEKYRKDEEVYIIVKTKDKIIHLFMDRPIKKEPYGIWSVYKYVICLWQNKSTENGSLKIHKQAAK